MTDCVNKAFLFALHAHDGQLRKDGLPYIVHPFEVGMLLARNGADEALICAGLLHDTVEDAHVTPEQLLGSFGEAVSELVREDSEDKSKSWEERKTAALRSLREGTDRQRMLMCADKLTNLRSIRDALEQDGEAVWQRFKRGRDKQAWLYRETVEALAPLAGLPMYEELKALTQVVFSIKPKEEDK